jgi:hypothetical protein
MLYLVIWLLALFLFSLSWVAAGVYLGKLKWMVRALSLAIFLRPVLFGFVPMPAGFCVFGYGLDYFLDHQRDMYPDLLRSLRAVWITAPIAWALFELFARANKYADERKHLNPLLNKRN